MTRRLVTIAQAADHYGVHHNTLRHWIAEGKITGYKFGSKMVRVDLDEIDDLVVPIPTIGTLQAG